MAFVYAATSKRRATLCLCSVIQWIYATQPLHSDKLSWQKNGIASSSSSSSATIQSTVLSYLLIIDAFTHILWRLFNFNRFVVYATQKPQVIYMFIFTLRQQQQQQRRRWQQCSMNGILGDLLEGADDMILRTLYRNVSFRKRASFMFDIVGIVLKLFAKLMQFF